MFSLLGKIHTILFSKISRLCFTYFTLLFSGRNHHGMKPFCTPFCFLFQTFVAKQNIATNTSIPPPPPKKKEFSTDLEILWTE